MHAAAPNGETRIPPSQILKCERLAPPFHWTILDMQQF